MSSLSVPKRQVRVSLSWGPETVEGFVFVAEFSEHTRGAERVGEILNQPGAFLPVRDARADRVFLYHKRAIHSLTVLEAERREWEVEELEFSPAEKIEITLVGGEVLKGITYLDPRPEKSRVSDLLNHPESFVVLVREEGVTYVSKRHILRVA
ncbi:MAG: hypothetical protein ABR599_04845 [Gemmatimonadota bacterium]